MKPILFNAKMVRAILDGRKTVTRRGVKPGHLSVLDSPYHKRHPETPDSLLIEKLCQPPYQPGQILYVRETFSPLYPDEFSERPVGYMYKADTLEDFDREHPHGRNYTWDGHWHPSIHMQKEAARIFLRVTDVRVERLQDINYFGCTAEGIPYRQYEKDIINDFSLVWDSTVKKADLDKYDWEANPWVWVIAFERISEEEALKNA